jgi:hypothetical protein
MLNKNSGLLNFCRSAPAAVNLRKAPHPVAEMSII